MGENGQHPLIHFLLAPEATPADGRREPAHRRGRAASLARVRSVGSTLRENPEEYQPSLRREVKKITF